MLQQIPVPTITRVACTNMADYMFIEIALASWQRRKTSAVQAEQRKSHPFEKQDTLAPAVPWLFAYGKQPPSILN